MFILWINKPTIGGCFLSNKDSYCNKPFPPQKKNISPFFYHFGMTNYSYILPQRGFVGKNTTFHHLSPLEQTTIFHPSSSSSHPTFGAFGHTSHTARSLDFQQQIQWCGECFFLNVLFLFLNRDLFITDFFFEGFILLIYTKCPMAFVSTTAKQQKKHPMDVQQQMGIFILYQLHRISTTNCCMIVDCMIFFAVNFFNFWRSPYGINLNFC